MVYARLFIRFRFALTPGRYRLAAFALDRLFRFLCLFQVLLKREFLRIFRPRKSPIFKLLPSADCPYWLSSSGLGCYRHQPGIRLQKVEIWCGPQQRLAVCVLPTQWSQHTHWWSIRDCMPRHTTYVTLTYNGCFRQNHHTTLNKGHTMMKHATLASKAYRLNPGGVPFRTKNVSEHSITTTPIHTKNYSAFMAVSVLICCFIHNFCAQVVFVIFICSAIWKTKYIFKLDLREFWAF